MSTGKTQEALVGDQFGARAAAYLTSAVHAQGADLQALVELVHDRPQARVLDLGCGGGHVSFGAAPHVREVVAYDLSPAMLDVVAREAAERSLRNLSTRQGVAEALPFEDGSFDVVLTRYSAHHWRDFDAGLREAARVLKPGGIFGAADSVSPGTPLLDTFLQAVEMLRDPSHVRSRSWPEWTAALARAGLRVNNAAGYRIRLEFQSWVERMRTPKVHQDAIRSLQAAMADSVTRHFEIAADGSFTLDVAHFRADKPAG